MSNREHVASSPWETPPPNPQRARLMVQIHHRGPGLRRRPIAPVTESTLLVFAGTRQTGSSRGNCRDGWHPMSRPRAPLASWGQHPFQGLLQPKEVGSNDASVSFTMITE